MKRAARSWSQSGSAAIPYRFPGAPPRSAQRRQAICHRPSLVAARPSACAWHRWRACRPWPCTTHALRPSGMSLPPPHGEPTRWPLQHSARPRTASSTARQAAVLSSRSDVHRAVASVKSRSSAHSFANVPSRSAPLLYPMIMTYGHARKRGLSCRLQRWCTSIQRAGVSSARSMSRRMRSGRSVGE